MNTEKIKFYLYLAIILGILIAALSVFWFAKIYFQKVQFSTLRSFNVSADGKVVAIPDVAKFTFAVITEGDKDLNQIQSKNTSQVNKIIDFLKNQGVEEKDIQTVDYNLSPRYQFYSCVSPLNQPRPCPPPEIVGYTLTQSVAVKIRNFSKIGDILGGVVSNGANNVSTLSFDIDDLTALQKQAREIAILKAQEQAKEIAKVGGFHLGKLVSINISYNNPQSRIMYNLGAGKVESETSAPSETPQVEAGSKEVTAFVTLEYEMK